MSYDEVALRCWVQARVEEGEDPQVIFDQLRRSPLVDFSDAKLAMSQLAPGRFTESPSNCRKGAAVLNLIRRLRAKHRAQEG